MRVSDPAVYAAQKATANAAAARLAGHRSPSASARVLAPAIVRNLAGQRDTTAAPSDSIGAIGITRYIELVNAIAAVYKRTSNTPEPGGSSSRGAHAHRAPPATRAAWQIALRRSSQVAAKVVGHQPLAGRLSAGKRLSPGSRARIRR